MATFPVGTRGVVGCLDPSVLTNQGGTNSSWRALMHGREDRGFVESLARDLGHYGEVTPELVEQLIDNSGIRELPLGKQADAERERALKKRGQELAVAVGKRLQEVGVDKAVLKTANLKDLFADLLGSRSDNLAVQFGGMLPGQLADTQELLRKMGFHPGQLQAAGYAGPFRNQDSNFSDVSRFAAMMIPPGLEALLSLGGTLPSRLAHPANLATISAHCYTGYDKLAALFDQAALGQMGTPFQLLFGFGVSPNALLKNLVLAPRFDYQVDMKRDPASIQKIIPEDLASARIAYTAGPNITLEGACAAALYGLYTASKILRDGEEGMEAALITASDATFAPLYAPAVLAGFGAKAPVGVDNLVARLIQEGCTPSLADGESLSDRWRSLDKKTKQFAMGRANSAGTQYADGLVMSEGAMGMVAETLHHSLMRGHWPRAIVAGISVGAGEGLQPDMAGMSQGGITTSGKALDNARKNHGVVPELTFLHGTSTHLFNFAEIQMLYHILKSRGIRGMSLAGLQSTFGHQMGTVGGTAAAMAVMSLAAGVAPLLKTFDQSIIDPRYAERIPDYEDYMRFASGTYSGSLEAILVQAFGFGDQNGSVVFKRVPQDREGFIEFARSYGATDDEIAIWNDKVDENIAFRNDVLGKLARGQLSYHDVAALIGYP